jgi:hypothetical protein
MKGSEMIIQHVASLTKDGIDMLVGQMKSEGFTVYQDRGLCYSKEHGRWFYRVMMTKEG